MISLRQLFILQTEPAIDFLSGCHAVRPERHIVSLTDRSADIQTLLKETHKSAARWEKASANKTQDKPREKQCSASKPWTFGSELLFCLHFVSCAEKQQSRALCQPSVRLNEEASPGSMRERTHPIPPQSGGREAMPSIRRFIHTPAAAPSLHYASLLLKWLHTGKVLFGRVGDDSLFPVSLSSEEKAKNMGLSGRTANLTDECGDKNSPLQNLNVSVWRLGKL